MNWHPVFFALLLSLACVIPGGATGSGAAANSEKAKKNAERPDKRDFLRRFADPEMRLRLQGLVLLPEAERQATLERWPRFNELTPEERERIKSLLLEVERRQRALAFARMKEYGLQLNPQQTEQFITAYLTRRHAEETAFVEQVRPMREAMEQRLREEMVNLFSPEKSGHSQLQDSDR